MKYLTRKIKEDIKQHSAQETPRECCGLIYREGQVYKSIRCKNVAVDTKNNFKINPADYVRAEQMGDIKAYYHSHVTDAIGVFSKMDRKVSDAHGVPLIMYCIEKNEFFEYNG